MNDSAMMLALAFVWSGGLVVGVLATALVWWAS